MRRLVIAAVCTGVLAQACSSDSSTGSQPATLADNSPTLSAVQERGQLMCGLNSNAVPFSQVQPDGRVVGFDADLCRALAAVVFGDAEDVEFVTLDFSASFTALSSGRVDVLFNAATHTQSRDTDLGLNFGPTTYYDGQQVLARSSAGFTPQSQFSDLDGATVCTQAGTTSEKNISDEAAATDIAITLNTFDNFDEVIDRFSSGVCDVVSTDGSALVGSRISQEPVDQDWVIFPPTPFSKEPLSPVFRQGDDQWRDIVNWTVYALFIADEYGVTSATAARVAADPDAAAELRRLFGAEGELQSGMGLDPDSFLAAIIQVGNYDELYSRSFARVGLIRAGGPNANWLDGGLHYAPPAR